MMRNCDEFDCASCGMHIVSLPPRDPPPTLCATCMWMDEFLLDPVERAEVLRRLAEPEGA
jgi:hypothetical protein